MIKINLAENLLFYNSYMPCDCLNCKNFCKQIKSTCRQLADFFSQYNIDIEKPWELVAIESGDQIEYVSCQYLVFGECSDDYNLRIGNITVKKELDGYPSTDGYKQPNFVLDFAISLPNNIKYKRIVERNGFMNEIVITDDCLFHFNIGDRAGKESSLIYYSKGKGHTIDFARCAENYNLLHSGSGICVAEKNISDRTITFFTSGTVTKIVFKKHFYLNRNRKKLLSGSRDKRFDTLVKLIEECGYTTCDLS